MKGYSSYVVGVGLFFTWLLLSRFVYSGAGSFPGKRDTCLLIAVYSLVIAAILFSNVPSGVLQRMLH